ncbi:uncharacterized protein BKA55DRAFT_539093 [Fusarium redolens]|uniref:Uncharacterized protein n=1 Tax=Fusarium redolens TaxID=48865 RepID=A0A9P9HAV2_FUSRE|nr:uncharacterized protein BKA55DRAFT_539093 [Fusarium redolens]KAH7254260.1 hypothetical protein BKA55DRAFT_539093 [Fusarium redolens]
MNPNKAAGNCREVSQLLDGMNEMNLGDANETPALELASNVGKLSLGRMSDSSAPELAASIRQLSPDSLGLAGEAASAQSALLPAMHQLSLSSAANAAQAAVPVVHEDTVMEDPAMEHENDVGHVTQVGGLRLVGVVNPLNETVATWATSREVDGDINVWAWSNLLPGAIRCQVEQGCVCVEEVIARCDQGNGVGRMSWRSTRAMMRRDLPHELALWSLIVVPEILADPRLKAMDPESVPRRFLRWAVDLTDQWHFECTFQGNPEEIRDVETSLFWPILPAGHQLARLLDSVGTQRLQEIKEDPQVCCREEGGTGRQ